VRLTVVAEIIKMKDFMADLQICIESYPPLSWAQVMQVLIDVYLMFTPVAFVSRMYIDGTEVQVWPLFSTFLVTIFFQGLLGMINLIRNPFGDNVDDFNFDYTLLRSERECLSYLGYPAEDSTKDSTKDSAARQRRETKLRSNDDVEAGGRDSLPSDSEDDSEDEDADAVFDPYKHAKIISMEQFELLSQGSKAAGGTKRKTSSSVGRASKSWRSASKDRAWQDNRSQGSESERQTTTEELIRKVSQAS